MSTAALHHRIRRRETHSPRSGAAVAVALLAIVALAWVVTETVLAAVGQRPLLLGPAAMIAGIAALPGAAASLLIVAGAVLALLGLVLLVIGVAPGRLGKHTLEHERAVVVIHDEVIGSALVRVAADTAVTDPDRAVATVGRRRATVRLTPTSGSPIDVAGVRTAVTERLQSFGLRPALAGRVVVARNGKVGA